MAKVKHKVDGKEVELNMTPMIDVVFNLIIFFMIVTDMTQKELEQLTLPNSSEAMEDDGQEGDPEIGGQVPGVDRTQRAQRAAGEAEGDALEGPVPRGARQGAK